MTMIVRSLVSLTSLLVRVAAGTRVPVGYPGNKLYPGNILLPDVYPGLEYLICRIYLIGFSSIILNIFLLFFV